MNPHTSLCRTLSMAQLMSRGLESVHIVNASYGSDCLTPLQTLDDIDGETGGGIGIFGDVEFLEHLIVGVGIVRKRANHHRPASPLAPSS